MTPGLRPADARRPLRWRVGVAAGAVVLAALTAACGSGAAAGGGGDGGDGGGDAFRPLTVGAPAPAIAVPLLGGDTLRAGDGAGVQPLTLVNVWATWCGPCREEFPELEALHRRYGGRGLRVVGVAIDRDGATAVRPFVTAQGTTFPIALDPDDAIRQRFFALGVPESWLIAPDGRLLWRQIGAIPPGAAAAQAAIDAALGSAGG